MKIIMHIGMPKTGSTAIQFALTKSRENLLSNGILYPVNPEPFSNQVKHMLYMSLLRQGDAGQWLKHPDMEQKIISSYGSNFDFNGYWISDLKKQILDAKPHTIIISEEGFFNALATKKSNIHKNLQNLLSELNVSASDFEIVGYLRSPPDYYLSSCQQTLKSKPEIISLRSANYIPAIKRIRGEYKSQHKLFPFDRKIFPQGDVVRHFTSYSCGIELESLGQPNETVSGSAMSILQEYRELFYSEGGQRRTPQQVQSLVGILRDAGKRIGCERPVLKADVAMKIWNEMRSELEWLKEQYGFNFDPPLGDTTNSLIAFEDDWQPQKVSDIIDFIQYERTRLLFDVIFQILKKTGKA